MNERADLEKLKEKYRAMLNSVGDFGFSEERENEITIGIIGRYVVDKVKTINRKRYAGIVTFMEYELDALKEVFGFDEENRIPKGNYTHYVGDFIASNKQEYSLDIVQALNLGQAYALNVISDLIQSDSMEMVICSGIAGGVKEEVALGDIIVAEEVIYYEQDKITKSGKLPSPRMFSADPLLLDRCKHLPPWDIAKENVSMPMESKPKIHFGVIASGNKIIASIQKIKELREQHRKIIGVDTEADAFYMALHLYDGNPPRGIVIRSVSDYAGKKKADPKWKKEKENWQKIAAEVVALYVRHLLSDDPLKTVI